jgi:hypothetical protein
LSITRKSGYCAGYWESEFKRKYIQEHRAKKENLEFQFR